MANNRNFDRLNTRSKGNIGENICCELLKNQGFSIVKRNYQKIWGEIDIIAKKDNVLHFIEVKSITHAYSESANKHRPEDNVDGWKLKHIRRMVETYIDEYSSNREIEFCFHVYCVYMNMVTRRAKVVKIENIIL